MPIIRQESICDKTIKFDEKCNLNLKIDLKTYDTNKQYYYVTYVWDHKNIIDHPFYYDKDFLDNNSDGEIIFKNTLSDNLIKFLMMSDTELKTESGSIHPKDYRILTMKAIALFWD